MHPEPHPEWGDTTLSTTRADTPGGKVFATCDVTGKDLTLGDWYHKRGEDFDICGEEFRRRPNEERAEYIAVTTLEALGDERSTYDTGTVAGEAEAETETGVSKAGPGFEPADSFSGARPNCVFKSGLQGLGYYATISREHLVTKSPHAEIADTLTMRQWLATVRARRRPQLAARLKHIHAFPARRARGFGRARPPGA